MIGIKCSRTDCNKYANHGTVWGNPILCKKHSKPFMYLVIEQRLYRRVKTSDSRKGKFFLDNNFLNRILKINNFMNIKNVINLEYPILDSENNIVPKNKIQEKIETKQPVNEFQDFDTLFNIDENSLNDLINSQGCWKEELKMNDILNENTIFPPKDEYFNQYIGESDNQKFVSIKDFLDSVWWNIVLNVFETKCTNFLSYWVLFGQGRLHYQC